MRFFLLLALIAGLLLEAATVEDRPWPKGVSFLQFLEKNGMPQSIYWNLDKEEQELCEEIRAGVHYDTMLDNNGTVLQVLIPISEELQIHLERNGGQMHLEFIPIAYETLEEYFALPIENSPYQDIVKATNNVALANAFVDAFKNSIDFRSGLRKGDMLTLVYEAKLRLGRPFGLPVIKAAMIETRKRPNYLYLFNHRYYDQKGREVEGFLFRKPVNNVRITSRFTLRRYHPVLKKYRAHLGVDFGARTGTPIYAAASGRVIFAGRKGGYGNVVKIRHRDGFVTLYAHMRKFRSGIRSGKRVKKGQVIGYVGSTGMSTGPHLHFGLYKNGRPINPLGVIKVTKRTLGGKDRKTFLAYAKEQQTLMSLAVKEKKSPTMLDKISDSMATVQAEAVGG